MCFLFVCRAQGGGSLPLPAFPHPSHALLDANGFQQIAYDKWRARCLAERAAKGARAAGGRVSRAARRQPPEQAVTDACVPS